MHLIKKVINYCITHHDWQVIDYVSRENTRNCIKVCVN